MKSTISTEQYVSDNLDLGGDFRKIKKTRLLNLVSDLRNMPSETARLVTEQFPAAAGNAAASVKSLFDKIPAFLEDESKTHESMMNMLSEDDERCWERINDPSVSDEERKRCYQRLAENKNHAHTECSDKRKFKIGLYDRSGAILLAAIGIPLTVLGVNHMKK
ncbi:hypothetical protein [Adlercreutzia muris]|uniref:Uncharacterized protein n=1 Tax=Adlercreutzia muris TaxID=1796610 RepID=A0A7C8BQ10_9ACTN|nr:hypothetical protein [Adlercreutzia muris]KAB1641728.1 hypothetical protein F8D48_09695 [Adlercreutzia muris]MCR2028737.1 hypothetical protein [Adlercreutzia muris]